IQQRGRVSLTVTVFVFPVLIAGCCSVYLQLSPYLNRQRSTMALKNAGVILQSRPPDQAGELLMNRSGKMLPVWLANAIGKECLSEVRSVRAKLEDLRISDLEQLETSKLWKVEFVQESSGSHLDARLIQWFNSCSQLKHVQFDFIHFAESDGHLLSQLAKRRECYLTIRNCESVDLTSLKHVSWLHLVGDTLNESNVRHLGRDGGSPLLRLEIKELPAKSISLFSGYRSHIALLSNVHADTYLGLAKLGLESISFENLVSPLMFNVRTDVDLSITRRLTIARSTISLQDCKQIAELFRCEWLRVDGIPKSNGIAAAICKLTAEQFEPFWELPNLQEISYFETEWKRLLRPAIKPSSK
ncbi:MAG: hypothetical protein ABL921_33565, partial [Pirellula sp.]